MSARLLPPPLIALSSGRLGPADGAHFLRRARVAVDAGLRGLLVREPDLLDRDLAGILSELGAWKRDVPDLWLAVHDRVHLAAALGLEAVHLGFRSLSPASVRARFGELVRGLSTHASDDPEAWEAADYLFHGPIHPTPSKVGLLEPIGWSGLARAVSATRRPVWAIGGLEPADVPRVLAAGAAGMAVLSGILTRHDPADATRRYLDAFTRARAS